MGKPERVGIEADKIYTELLWSGTTIAENGSGTETSATGGVDG